MDSESALFRICHSRDAILASVISRVCYSCVCDSCVCSPASHFQNPRPPEYIPLVFSPFSLSSPNASFTYLDSAFNAEILSSPPYAAFNAFQINSHQVIMTFVLLLNAALAFSLDAALVPAFGPFWPKRSQPFVETQPISFQ